MILSHQIDASAIDSTVLELQLERYPEIRSDIRIIETLGPSPIPPWVILKSVPQDLRAALRELLLKMHKDPQGRAILAEGRIDRFVRVEDRDYDAIRHMSRRAQAAALPVTEAESSLCRVEMRACRQTLQARNNPKTAAAIA